MQNVFNYTQALGECRVVLKVELPGPPGDVRSSWVGKMRNGAVSHTLATWNNGSVGVSTCRSFLTSQDLAKTPTHVQLVAGDFLFSTMNHGLGFEFLTLIPGPNNQDISECMFRAQKRGTRPNFEPVEREARENVPN